jgi:hypothetical protein
VKCSPLPSGLQLRWHPFILYLSRSSSSNSGISGRLWVFLQATRIYRNWSFKVVLLASYLNKIWLTYPLEMIWLPCSQVFPYLCLGVLPCFACHTFVKCLSFSSLFLFLWSWFDYSCSSGLVSMPLSISCMLTVFHLCYFSFRYLLVGFGAPFTKSCETLPV